MSKNKVLETKQRFTLRKNKKYKNLVSVGLGLFIVAGAGVIAGEEAKASEEKTQIITKTENPATNNPEAQPNQTEEAKESINNTEKTNGTVEITIDKTNLEKAVENAKNNGLKTEKEEDKDLGTAKTLEEARKKQEEIQKDYNKQQEEITKQTEKYIEEKANHKQEVEKITEENTALENKYKEEVKKYNEEVKKVNNYNKEVQAKYDRELQKFNEEVEKINKENKEAKAEYEKAYQTYLTKVNQITEENKKQQEDYNKKYEDYKKEKEQIEKENNEAKEKYEKELAEYNKTKEQTTKTNEEAKKEYERKLAEYEAKKEAVEKENAKLKEEYERKLQEAEKNKTEIEASNLEIERRNAKKKEEYEKELAEYNIEKAEYERKVAEYELNKKKDGYLSEVVPQNFIFNTEPEAKSVIEGDYTYVEKLTHNVTSTQLANMTSVDLSDKSKILVTYTNLKNSRYKDTNISKTTYEIQNITGNKLRVYVIDDPTMGIQIGTGNYLAPKAKIKIKFYDKNDNIINFSEEYPALIGLSSLTNWEQAFDINNRNIESIENYNFDFIKITGSSVEEHSDGIYSNKNNMEISRGAKYEYKDTDNVESNLYYYLGGAGKITKGNSIDFTVAKYNGDRPNEWNGTWVSFTSDIATITGVAYKPTPTTPPTYEETPTGTSKTPTPPEYKPLPEKPVPPTSETEPTPPKEPNYNTKEITPPTNPTPKETPKKPEEPEYKPLPKKPTLDEFKVLPPEPNTPKYKEVPKAPETPTIKYNYINFDTEPNIYKEVKNTEGTNINNNLVSKLSTVNWELKTEDLPAGREKIKTYKITDNLPTGFEINLENTKELSKGFTVEYDKKTNTVIFTADENTIMFFNKDKTKEITPIYPVASGEVVNDGATYENNFRLDIETETEDVGNVYVNYIDTQGNTISKTVIDTKNGKIGTSYDTTDNKPQEIAYKGELYKITPQIKGKETGEIIKGNIEITYIYDKIQQKENTGNVVIHYIDTKGNTIKEDIVDEKEQPVETNYDTTDNKPQEITKNGVTYKITSQIKGKETGKITQGTTEITYIYERTTPEETGKTYTKYSNKVVVYTPGNDPKKPRPPYPTTPENPENPTPHDNLIKPEKHNTNKDGVIIDGKTLLPNTTNYYKLIWDLDQYKGIKASTEEINKGFYYIEDYPEEALELKPSLVKLTDSLGQTVKGIKIESYESIDKATDKIKTILEKAKITPQGAFQIFIAENPEDFFKNYVEIGNTITITSPMIIKENYTGEYKNKAYQIDFGNGYETEEVKNDVIKPTPEKHNTNKDGIIIDGKTLLPNTTNYYKLTWDLDQYKNIAVEKEDIQKGFYYVEDYPEEALELKPSLVKLTDSLGQTVKGIKIEAYDSLDKATEEVKAILSSAKITPQGAFQIFIAENPEDFFKNYVEIGNTITITSPMIVKENYTGEYKNKAYQIDFGFGYETEIIENNIPKLEPKKDVVIDITHSTESLDKQTIELGKTFNYHLVGAKIPANRGEEITQYAFYDDYDEKGDQYDGVYKVFTTTNITLKDKTQLEKGTDITKHTTQVIDKEKGIVKIELDKEFLEKVSLDSEFQADVYLQMKRIASGTYKNTYINTINGYETTSNTVETNTPEPSKPEEPKKPEPEKPKEPKKEEPKPKTPEKTLPKTSAAKQETKQKDKTNEAGIIAGALALGTLTLIRKRKVEK